jgi:hypothetical protein
LAILYLIVLHLWAFFILSFHTHQLEQAGGAPVVPADVSTDGVIISPTGQRIA